MVNRSKTSVKIGALSVCIACVLACIVQGDVLTIPEVQYTESSDGASPCNGQVIDCLGGIVVAKVAGGRPRLFLQDPNALDGWGAIQIKGWVSDAFADVSLGDWVEIKQTFVEEYRGTTFLQYWDENPDGSQPVLTVVSHGHDVPRPLVVDVNEIKAPEYQSLEDAWVVPDHRAERLESMLLRIRDVVVVEQDLGKAQDNYELRSFREPNDTGALCWASDYANQNRQKPDLYLPGIEMGRRFRAVTGVLEQYTNLGEGFDYYQLLTLSETSVVGLCPADLDQDGDVDLWDSKLLIEQLLAPSLPQVGDLNSDGKVDAVDLDLFNAAWQQADVNGDGIVDGDDLRSEGDRT
jgi:hypothetical protein